MAMYQTNAVYCLPFNFGNGSFLFGFHFISFHFFSFFSQFDMMKSPLFVNMNEFCVQLNEHGNDNRNKFCLGQTSGFFFFLQR